MSEWVIQGTDKEDEGTEEGWKRVNASRKPVQNSGSPRPGPGGPAAGGPRAGFPVAIARGGSLASSLNSRYSYIEGRGYALSRTWVRKNFR